MIETVHMISHVQVAELIGSARLDLSTEATAHAGLYTFLAARLPLGCALEREVRLSHTDRLDLLVDGRIVVELKASRAQARQVIAQLERYAAFDQVGALVLASNRAIDIPSLIGGKPAVFVSLGRAWL